MLDPTRPLLPALLLLFTVAAPGARADEAMVKVPAGKFTMGCDASDPACSSRTQIVQGPARQVILQAFEIDRTEVSQASYAACVKVKACQRPRQGYNPVSDGKYPVTWVTWEQASAYCRFAGKRLPTEAEWEKAARGTDGRRYPWGVGGLDCKHANVDVDGSGKGCGPGGLVEVGSLPSGASPYGALDMLGNAAEWVSDWFAEDSLAKGAANDPTGPPSGDLKVYKGGSYSSPAREILRAGYRHTQQPSNDQDNLGFRCARSLR